MSKKIATIDFETDPFKYGRFPKAFAVGFFDGSCYQSKWGSHRSCVDWASKKCKGFDGIVYAHNGGKFDFLAYLLEGGGREIWGEPVMCIAGRIVKMRYGQAELRDSYAILPAPLKSHDKGEIDYRWFEADVRDQHRSQIMEYLKRDCTSLHELVMAFIEEHGLRPLTAASGAMRYAKKLGVKVETFKQSQDDKFRQFYFGGLVLARKPGIHRGSFFLYDIKSAYPYAMLHAHSSGSNFTFNAKPSSVDPTAFYVVEGKFKNSFIRRTDDGNEFGGDGIFHVTGWELLQCISNGSFIGKIHCGEIPSNTTNFKTFVSHFFDAKNRCEQTGDKAGRLINKIMLNALYGKYAQRNDRFRDFFLMPIDQPLQSGFELEAEFDEAGLAIWSKPSEGGNLYNVSTAASITGFVRAMLMKAIYETDPYYCDTDSIIVDEERRPSGIHAGLGGWGLEARGDTLMVAGKKLYALRIIESECPDETTARKKGYQWDGHRGWKVASKGCRLTPTQMQEICEGGSIKYNSDAPSYSLLNSPFFVTRTIRATAR